MAAVCGFVGYVTVFVTPIRDMITQRGNSSQAFHLAQDIREQDSNFLDDLAQKQNQDDHHDGDPLSASDQNSGKAGTVDDDLQRSLVHKTRRISLYKHSIY